VGQVLAETDRSAKGHRVYTDAIRFYWFDTLARSAQTAPSAALSGRAVEEHAKRPPERIGGAFFGAEELAKAACRVRMCTAMMRQWRRRSSC